MDSIPPGLLDNLSAVAIGLLVVWAIATGKLITRREADGIRKDRDEWKSAYQTSDSDRRLQSTQTNELLEHAKVTEALIRGLSEVAHRETS